MKHVFFHYTDEDHKRPEIHRQDWVTTPRCYEDEIVMISLQSEADSFPSLK